MKTTKFKPSEVGPIPEEWEVKRLGDCAEIARGGSPRPIEAYLTTASNGLNWVKIGDVGVGAKYIERTEEKIKPEGLSSTRQVSAGDFVLSNSMSFGRPYIMKIDGCIHDGWLVIQDYRKQFETEYLFYSLGSEWVFRQYKTLAAGSSVLNLNKDVVARVVVPVPPRPEQEKIAEALSDVDALLAAMTKLIEKKRAIKQGAMQQLLTGKKRLAGFTGKWVEKRLGDVADFMTATTPTASIDLRWYIGTENMLADKAGVTQNFASVPYKVVREYIKGDVLTSNIRPYLKKIWLADRNGGCSTDVLVLRTHDRAVCIPEFLVMLVSDDAFFDFAMANAVGTKMPRGDKKVLVNFEVRLPSVPEQQAIASVLSDMDAEIAALEAKRAKYESIKQGMMQELLTGKTRLV